MMYYLYLFKLIIIVALLIAIPNYLIFVLIREKDKSNYIEGYYQKHKIVTIISEVIYQIITHALIVFFIPALVYYIAVNKFEKKKMRITFSNLLVTPILGIVIPMIWIIWLGIYASQSNYDTVAHLLHFIRIIYMCISVPFFVIFAIKQHIRFCSIENRSIFTLVGVEEHQKSKEISKKRDMKKFQRNLKSHTHYLKRYADEEEWKKDKFNVINYGLFYKLLVIFSSGIVLLVNILVAIVYFDILDKPYTFSPTDYQIIVSPLFGDQFMYFYLYFTAIGIFVLLVIFVTYLINGKIVFLYKKGKYNDKSKYVGYDNKLQVDECSEPREINTDISKKIELAILGLSMLILLLILSKYPYTNSSVYDKLSGEIWDIGRINATPDTMSFDEHKIRAVEAIDNKYNFAEYTEEQKYGYIMSNPEAMIDDLTELGYSAAGPQENKVDYEFTYDPEIDFFMIELPFAQELSQYYELNDNDAYIEMGEESYWVYTEAMEVPGFAASIIPNDRKYDDQVKGYSSVEKQVYDEMNSQVFELIDTLFEMEMEDQGVEL